jgi:hypothetical protein
MLEDGTDAVLCHRRAPLQIDRGDLVTLAGMKKKIGEMLEAMKGKRVSVMDLSISEICTCPIHIRHLHTAGIRRLYLLMEADVLQIAHLLAEAEQEGARRLYHLHALLHSSVRRQ